MHMVGFRYIFLIETHITSYSFIQHILEVKKSFNNNAERGETFFSRLTNSQNQPLIIFFKKMYRLDNSKIDQNGFKVGKFNTKYLSSMNVQHNFLFIIALKFTIQNTFGIVEEHIQMLL